MYSHFLVFWFLRTLALRIFRYYVLWHLRTLASSYPGIFNNACIGMLVFPFPGTQVPAYFGTPGIAYFRIFVLLHLAFLALAASTRSSIQAPAVKKYPPSPIYQEGRPRIALIFPFLSFPSACLFYLPSPRSIVQEVFFSPATWNRKEIS